MATDLLKLLQRDHDEIERGLQELADPSATAAQIRSALDGVRLGLLAHAEAEDIVLERAVAGLAQQGQVAALVERARAAHLEQERALSALVLARPGTPAWRDRAIRLRDMVRAHADIEERLVIPALREAASPDAYARLAGAFATERLRQLTMLLPSAPIAVAHLESQVLASA
jgi:hypothetical protein